MPLRQPPDWGLITASDIEPWSSTHRKSITCWRYDREFHLICDRVGLVFGCGETVTFVPWDFCWWNIFPSTHFLSKYKKRKRWHFSFSPSQGSSTGGLQPQGGPRGYGWELGKIIVTLYFFLFILKKHDKHEFIKLCYLNNLGLNIKYHNMFIHVAGSSLTETILYIIHNGGGRGRRAGGLPAPSLHQWGGGGVPPPLKFNSSLE